VHGLAAVLGVHFKSDLDQLIDVLAQHLGDKGYGEDRAWGNADQAFCGTL
jgi:hypothetical protein